MNSPTSIAAFGIRKIPLLALITLYGVPLAILRGWLPFAVGNVQMKSTLIIFVLSILFGMKAAGKIQQFLFQSFVWAYSDAQAKLLQYCWSHYGHEYIGIRRVPITQIHIATIGYGFKQDIELRESLGVPYDPNQVRINKEKSKDSGWWSKYY